MSPLILTHRPDREGLHYMQHSRAKGLKGMWWSFRLHPIVTFFFPKRLTESNLMTAEEILESRTAWQKDCDKFPSPQTNGKK